MFQKTGSNIIMILENKICFLFLFSVVLWGLPYIVRRIFVRKILFGVCFSTWVYAIQNNTEPSDFTFRQIRLIVRLNSTVTNRNIY